MADGLVRGKSEAAFEAGVSVGVVEGLIDEGALETLVLPPEPVARAARSRSHAARAARRRSRPPPRPARDRCR